jgi:hypothetical protein
MSFIPSMRAGPDGCHPHGRRYRLPRWRHGWPAAIAQVIPLSGDFQLVEGFNLNGIEATHWG